MEELKNRMKDRKTCLKYRKSGKAFTRKRKQSFFQLLLLIMSSVKKSISYALYKFYEEIEVDDFPSKSAFSQRRQGLDHKVFIDLSSHLTKRLYQDKGIKYWNGRRLLAIDGSTTKLAN